MTDPRISAEITDPQTRRRSPACCASYGEASP